MNRRGKAILYLVAIFLAGTAAGFIAGRTSGRQQALAPPKPAQMAEHLIARLQQQLKLTADQLEKIRPLVEQSSASLDAIHYESWQRVSDSFKTLNQQIAGHLNADQTKKLAEMESARLELVHRKCGPLSAVNLYKIIVETNPIISSFPRDRSIALIA